MPLPVTADDLVDRCLSLLGKWMGTLEKIAVPEREDIDVVIRLVKATQEIAQVQLDPLGEAGRRKLAKMSASEIDAAKERMGIGVTQQ